MRVTSKGQVTIPQAIRKQLGIEPHSEVEFVVADGRVTLRACETATPRGDKLIERLRGRASVRMSTDEIMSLTRGEHGT